MTTSSSFVGLWAQCLRLVQDASSNPACAADPFICSRIEMFRGRVKVHPSPPKSAWKKLVKEMQVPLQLGAAFCAASQHNGPTSPAVRAALGALDMLLDAATSAGLKNDSGAVGALGTSMRQQLQQAGVLPQLASLMAALAAELRAEAAALGSKSSQELCASYSPAYRKSALQQMVTPVAMLLSHLQGLWGWSIQTATADNSIAWVVDSSGHAEATMQLCNAALQHASSMLRYVLPAVQPQGAPQLIAELQSHQAGVAATTMGLSSGLMAALSNNRQLCQWPDHGAAGNQALQEAQSLQLQQLLLSPHCLPCIASQLVLCACYVSKAARLPWHGRQQQTGGSGVDSNSASHSTSATQPHTLTPCQLQLLDLLGLDPQLAAAVGGSGPQQAAESTDSSGMSFWLNIQLPNTVIACSICSLAASDMACHMACCTADQHEEDISQQPPQQQQLEQQLWMLLPSLLLPCAQHLLLLAAANEDPQQRRQHIQSNAVDLMQLGKVAVMVGQQLPLADGRSAPGGLPHPSWMAEVLSGVLQLGGYLPPQHCLQPALQAAPAAAAGTSQQGSSLRLAAAVPADRAADSSGVWARREDQAKHTSALVELLSLLVFHSLVHVAVGVSTCNDSPSDPGLMGSSSSNSSDTGTVPALPAAAAGVTAPGESLPQLAVAQRLVEVCATLEAGLRASTAAVQESPFSAGIIANSVDMFLDGSLDPAGQPALLLHLGLAGALPAQLRQLYSLLSTVQKLGRCQSAVEPGKLCWGQETADACCWAAGQAAASRLLLMAGPEPCEEGVSETEQAAPLERLEAASSAGKQQPESSFLPSLVIFGRCCLVWADQLQQQAPQLLLTLASGSAGGQQQEQLGGVHAQYSAASVCVPEMLQQQEEGEATSDSPVTDTPPPCGLEWTLAAVAAWVDGVTAPATQAALAAAAGGQSLDQFRQQLEALAAAQLAVRQGLTDASLSALVQQLRHTGAMLSRVAVPHFCNNAGCVNISGPTEVGLVSGRSCLCSGCRTARYCGCACQRAAWPQHKRVCKALAAAAAAAPAAGV